MSLNGAVFNKVAPYIMADYIQELQAVTLLPNVKVCCYLTI